MSRSIHPNTGEERSASRSDVPPPWRASHRPTFTIGEEDSGGEEDVNSATIRLAPDSHPSLVRNAILKRHLDAIHRTPRLTWQHKIDHFFGHFNKLSTREARRAIEWCDFTWVPNSVRQGCQDILTQLWVTQIPLVQSEPPAYYASNVLGPVLSELYNLDRNRPTFVVDFCSGSGGPIPKIEEIINERRRAAKYSEVRFILTDLHPHSQAWSALHSKQPSVSWVSSPVDAANPPPSLCSPTALQNDRDGRLTGNEPRIFRLFNLALHHFDDKNAKNILASTLRTSDGFAIIELQDRRWGCMLMMIFNFFVALLTTWRFFPFKTNKRHWILTYSFILPFIVAWDGIASCLRTLEFEEVMALIQDIETPASSRQGSASEGSTGSVQSLDSASSFKGSSIGGVSSFEPALLCEEAFFKPGSSRVNFPPNGRSRRSSTETSRKDSREEDIVIQYSHDTDGSILRMCKMKGWAFTGGRVRHTFPFGFVNYTIGIRRSDDEDERERQDSTLQPRSCKESTAQVLERSQMPALSEGAKSWKGKLRVD